MGWFNVIAAVKNGRGVDQDLQNARAIIKSLQADLDRLQNKKDIEVKKDVQNAEFVIDWKNMDAFSIERMGDPKDNYTVIGYWVVESGEKRVHEWKFYCSLDQHNKLAKEFKEYGKKK